MNKPMIYYPLSVLMLAGTREVMIISSPEFLPHYKRLFGDGSQLGLEIVYGEQARPEGLPRAFTIARDWIAGQSVALVPGDNIFFGNGPVDLLRSAAGRAHGATIFSYRVEDPERYGVVEFDERGRARTLAEKPAKPRSHHAVTGLYLFDHHVSDFAAGLTPSARAELEITDLIRLYLDAGALNVEQMGRGYAWLDTGTHDSLLEAGEFVRTVQRRQGIQIACLEEIAYLSGFISRDAPKLKAKPWPRPLMAARS